MWCKNLRPMELHLDLEHAAGATLRARVEGALRDGIRTGLLAPGTRLPASRTLCAQLGVSRGVVVDAYAQLTAEGYLRARQGAGIGESRVPVSRCHGVRPRCASPKRVRRSSAINRAMRRLNVYSITPDALIAPGVPGVWPISIAIRSGRAARCSP